MIVAPDASEHLHADVCIIGGGPAGITLAVSLPSNVKVVLLVGGGDRTETAADLDLNRGRVLVPGSHEPLEENRRRVFGGATTIWGGRCIPLDPIDFLPRDWINESGWPIPYDEVAQYYQEALDICEAGRNEFDARVALPGTPAEIIPRFDNEDIVSWPLERWSTPVNFASKYRDAIQSASNIHMLLDTHAIELKKEGGKIRNVLAVHTGRQLMVSAQTFVLAAGGIENPRIMLASKSSADPQGIGNRNGLVGRYYMCHPHGIFATATLKANVTSRLGYEKDSSGVYCRRRWWVTPDFQQKAKIGNAILFLDRPRPTQGEGHRDALFSLIHVAKAIRGAMQRGGLRAVWSELRRPETGIRDHIGVLIKSGPSTLPTIINIARSRLTKERRLPSILPQPGSTKWGVYVQVEQEPNRDSRVLLSDSETDAHGMPRAVVDLKFTERDKQTLVDAHEVFRHALLRSGAGELHYDLADLKNWAESFSGNFNSAAHHLGATRMSETSETGVVDKDLLVFGEDNLYVAGGSVFPTGGHANPTLTIVALSLRLAAHLSKRFSQG